MAREKLKDPFKGSEKNRKPFKGMRQYNAAGLDIDAETDFKGFVRIPDERLIDQKMIMTDIGGEGQTLKRKRAKRELDRDDMMHLADRLTRLNELSEKGDLKKLLKESPVAGRKQIMAKGGMVKKKCDGIAKRGKTKGRMV